MKRKSKIITAALLLSLLLSLSFTLVGAEGEATPAGGVEAAYSEAALPNGDNAEGIDEARQNAGDAEGGAEALSGTQNTSPEASANTENSAKPDTGAGIEVGAEVRSTPDTGAGIDTDAEISGGANGTESLGEDGAISESPDAENAKAEIGGGARGFFEELYGAVMSRSAEITSALAAITSIILAILMKRGLTPMLKDALATLAGAVGKLRDGVSESEQHAKEISAALADRLSAAERTVNALSDTVSALEEKRASEGEEQMLREDILTVMSAEVELLYDVFMSSALPQYKKDEVGERFAAMRKRLGYREGSGDEA